MKAYPLSNLPKLQQLSRAVAADRNIDYFNIGTHCVLYRDNTDSMGDHADDDQGEEVIFCAVVQCSMPRKVRINVMKRHVQQSGNQEGDEIIEVFLQSGDCYEMDGVMQKSYSHCIPKVTIKSEMGSPEEEATTPEERRRRFQRLSIILRKGQEQYFNKDNGRLVNDLSPKPPIKYTFGHMEGRL
ncbi:MAG: hypothetical protein SGARI_005987 [Bacillariaceae sp.]